MKFSTLFWMTVALIGGIYITSEEGNKVRQVLDKKKSVFMPIIKDLSEQANQVLQGSQDIKSSQIRANVERLISEAKDTLINLDLEKTIDYIKEGIKVSSQKIREAFNKTQKSKNSLYYKK